MTQHARANLKAKFESGDSPDKSDFGDLIDSSPNLLDTNPQVFSGRLEALSITLTDPVSADNIHYENLSIATGADIDATTVISPFVRASAVHHNSAHLLVYGSGTAVQVGFSGGVTDGASILGPGGFVVGAAGDGGEFSFGLTTSPIFILTNVTAVMHIKYTVMIDSDLAGTYTLLGYDSSNLNIRIPESRCTKTITPGSFSCFSGQFMRIMASETNDRFQLRLMNSAATTGFNFTVGSYNLSVRPISYRSF